MTTELKKAILAGALDVFSTKVLADDMLSRAITTTLLGGETTTDGIYKPGFRVTPNIIDGKYSLCLEESAKFL